MKMVPWRRRDSMLPFFSDFDELFTSPWTEPNGELTSHLPEVFQRKPFPALNIAETEDGFAITLDCPGLDEKDFQVEVMGRSLVISGERKWEKEKKGKEYRRVESQYGHFERTVRLPENARLEAGKVDATYKKGVLTVTVPKLEKTPTTKVEVHG